MDKLAYPSSDEVDPRSAASSLQRDFAELVRIFNRELAKVRTDPRAHLHMIEAKQAAERGLQLSKQLAILFPKGD